MKNVAALSLFVALATGCIGQVEPLRGGAPEEGAGSIEASAVERSSHTVTEAAWFAKGAVKPSAVIVFGDSLSDGGTYTPVSPAGTKFLNNAGRTWAEDIADDLGLPLCAAFHGWATVETPVLGCTNYAQGGSRVKAPNGIGNEKGLRKSTITRPLYAQVEAHVEREGGFRGDELVLMLGGSNDVFFQFEQGRFGSGGRAELEQAARDLVDLAESEVLGRGARHVVLFTLPDAATAPIAHKLPSPLRSALTKMVRSFNETLTAEIKARHLAVTLVDLNQIASKVQSSASDYGITNTSTPACDADKIKEKTGISGGVSLYCDETTVERDSQTYMFADMVHPTSFAHRVLATEVERSLAEASLREKRDASL